MLSVLSVFTACALLGEAPAITDLVKAHESTFELIHTIQLQLDITGWGTRSAGSSPEHPTQFATWHWSKSGNLQRVKYRDHSVTPAKSGRTNNRGDVFSDGKVVKSLRNWDPESPQELTPIIQGSVHASISPQTREIVGRDPASQLLFTMCLPVSSYPYGLRELVSRSSPPAQLIGKAVVSGTDCWELRIELPSSKSVPEPGGQITVFLDPTHGFLVRKTIMRQQVAGGAGSTKTNLVQAGREVREFTDFGNGVFVPKLIDTYNLPDPSSGTMRATVSQCKVNAPLGPDAFAFTFPENAQVAHNPPVNGKRLVQLWGADNQPKADIRSLKDLEQYLPQRDSPTRPSSPKWILAGGVTIIVIVGLILWRRRNR